MFAASIKIISNILKSHNDIPVEYIEFTQVHHDERWYVYHSLFYIFSGIKRNLAKRNFGSMIYSVILNLRIRLLYPEFFLIGPGKVLGEGLLTKGFKTMRNLTCETILFPGSGLFSLCRSVL
jgi:hypothetical protein